MFNFKPGAVLLALPAFALGTAFASATPLKGEVVATVPHVALTDLGRAPGNGYLNIALTLRYRNQATLDALDEAQTDPDSPVYLHWLTNAQFNNSFAPSQADYARVIRSLQSNGFRITHTFANRTVVDASGPVRDVERFFNTEIHRVMQPGAGFRYANTRPAAAPAELRGVLMSVGGLHDLALVHTNNIPVPAKTEPFQPNTAGLPLKGPKGGFGPLAFSQGYDFPNQHGDTGTGRVSGVVIDADFVDTDLSGFLTNFNVTRTGPATVRVKIDGGPPGGDGSPDSLEASLDVETIVSNAPGTALYVYEFPSFNNLSFITDSYNQVVSDNLVDTANSSFGGCELGFPSDAMTWDHIAQQGAVKGITFHASTGDNGANQCSGLGVQAPSDGPHFGAIGGTSLFVDNNGNYTSETGWSGSGGGVSTVFPLPKWQKNVANVIASGRNLPDVSFDANPGTGAALLWKGNWSSIGGTSLSSPLFGAAMTELDQVKGARYGQANKKIFKFWKKNGYKHGKKLLFFHDITSGNNGFYSAGTGYDQVTGIGSMEVWNYTQNI